MLYFVKRNHRIEEFKNFYKGIQSLFDCLDKLCPEIDRAKAILYDSKKESLTAIGKYLDSEHGFKIEEFLKLELTKKITYEELNLQVLIIEKILESLKNYESYQGRIKFSQFANLFNFEEYIYEDKQFQYSIISNYNKRIIPEFISATFSHMIYENLIGEEIRRSMEQYFIAIMSNMDYLNFAHVGQLKQELKGVLKKDKNLIYIIGAAPHTFNDDEYVELLNERIKTADDLIIDGIEFNCPNPMWKKELDSKYSIEKSALYFSKNKEHSTLGEVKIEGETKTSKLTSENLDYIYNDIKIKKVTNYNLFIVTSTFHILKTAIEIERHFYNSENHKPDNIIFIGNEKFFELAHNKSKCKNEEKSKYHKKKIKSFLYELFMHTLDKNAIK